jgi:hypothetical protein
VAIDADRNDLIRPAGQDACGLKRTLAASRATAEQCADDFPDPILFRLLTAQAAWMGTRDPVALRRALIAILAELG